MHKPTLSNGILKGGYFWILEEFSQVRRFPAHLWHQKEHKIAWVWLSPRPWPRGSTQFISKITLTSLLQSSVKSELRATTSRLNFKTVMTRVSRWWLLEEIDENKFTYMRFEFAGTGILLSLRWAHQSLIFFLFFFAATLIPDVHNLCSLQCTLGQQGNPHVT